jgi:AraC-like DNA-binding protein
MIAFLEKKTTGFLIKETHKLKFPAHLHRHIEFVILLESSTIAYAGTECCTLHAGDAFIAFPNQVHRYEQLEEGERSIIIIMDPDAIPELSSAFFESLPSSAHIKNFLTDDIKALCARLFTLSEVHTPLEETERRALLTALFARVLSACHPTAKERANTATSAVVAYCARHYTENLSLGTLAGELHISPYHISHVFTEKLGIGFNEYVNSLRVSHACRHLAHKEYSITEISTMVGFSGPRTFNRAFAKCMGITPSEYRKQHQTEKE